MSDQNEENEVLQNPEMDIFDPSKDLENEQSDEISALSKKGYQLLKENKIKEAKDEFTKILDIENNNNYALVGLGDSERKLNHYHDAIDYYSKCLSFHPIDCPN